MKIIESMLKAMESEEMEPQINADKRRLNALSEDIIGAAFEVSNVPGVGFLEKVYENALKYRTHFKGIKNTSTSADKRNRYCSFCPVLELS